MSHSDVERAVGAELQPTGSDDYDEKDWLNELGDANPDHRNVIIAITISSLGSRGTVSQ